MGSGNHEFKSFCTNPNAGNDNNTLNDTMAVNFRSNANPTFANFHLLTDNFGSETSWIIRDASGAIFLSGGGYTDVNGGEQISESLCLYDSCFTFVLQDAYGDGFCCSFGNGSFYLEDNFGDTIASTTTFSSDSISFPFCLNTNSIETISENDFKLFPNPSDGQFTIETRLNQGFDLIVLDILGHEVLSRNVSSNSCVVDLSQQSKGIYFVLIKSESTSITRRLVLH